MRAAVFFSFLGHLVVLGIMLLVAGTRGERASGATVYNVSIVAGTAGGPGSGGKAPVGIAGMVGKPGKIGSAPLSQEKSAKGAALVEEARKGKKTGAKTDTTRSNSAPIALRVYGTGGTIGGGGQPGDSGTGVGTGRPATAFEVAMNGKILPNWNENLWKGLPERLICTISFLIDADGAVSHVEVFQSSGNDAFDLAARRAIELARLPAPASFGMTGDLHPARVTFINRSE
jgi:TonB family protein